MKDIDEQGAPILTHLSELRRRVRNAVWAWVIAFGLCYFFADRIYAFLVEPLAEVLSGESRRLIYTNLAEAFLTYAKLAAYSATLLAFPVMANQLYLFLAPGLYRKEKRVLLPYLVLSPILFAMGVALADYYVIPLAWGFFASFEQPVAQADSLPIVLEARVAEYLGLMMQIMFAFGISFQLPILLTLLTRVGLASTAGLKRFRRIAAVIMLVAAGILTPPDVLSQISLFIPLYLLYELSILACGMIEKKRAANALPAVEDIA